MLRYIMKCCDYFRDIDEIVLSYVNSILEDLGDDSNAEENIDVDQFAEMMEAYIPGFGNIDRFGTCIRIQNWLINFFFYNVTELTHCS